MRPLEFSIQPTGHGEALYVIACDHAAQLAAPVLALSLAGIPRAAFEARIKLLEFRQLARGG